MTMKSAPLDSWRDFFRRADTDIFEIIHHAIIVAATDCPKEFKSRRDKIAELLFSCRFSRCTGCDRLELAVPGDDEAKERDNRGGGGGRGDGVGVGVGVGDDDDEYDEFGEAGGSKESKANSSRGDNQVEMMNININQIVSNYSYGEAEALTAEIEEASEVVGEVLRIKDVLLNSQDQSNSVLFESLRRLQLMALTVDILKGTEIGKAVNGLRKHGSERIRQLAKTLIDDWKDLVDQWVNSTKDITGMEGTPDSVNPSVVDEEEGLPSPPLDEGVFFATEPTGMELAQFFDGMDDDGNPWNCGEFSKNRESRRKPSVERQNVIKRQPQASSNEANLVAKDNKSSLMKRQEAPVRSSKPSNGDSMPRRVPKPSVEQKVKEPMSVQKFDRSALQKKQLSTEQKRKLLGGQQNKLKCSDEDAKFESAKRKLQESYQQHENAKRQRTIQVLEDIPKQGHQKPPFNKRPGNFNRHWANGRR